MHLICINLLSICSTGVPAVDRSTKPTENSLTTDIGAC